MVMSRRTSQTPESVVETGLYHCRPDWTNDTGLGCEGFALLSDYLVKTMGLIQECVAALFSPGINSKRFPMSDPGHQTFLLET